MKCAFVLFESVGGINRVTTQIEGSRNQWGFDVSFQREYDGGRYDQANKEGSHDEFNLDACHSISPEMRQI